MPQLCPLRLVQMQLTARKPHDDAWHRAGADNRNAPSDDDAGYEARRCHICQCKYPSFGFGPPCGRPEPPSGVVCRTGTKWTGSPEVCHQVQPNSNPASCSDRLWMGGRRTSIVGGCVTSVQRYERAARQSANWRAQCRIGRATCRRFRDISRLSRADSAQPPDGAELAMARWACRRRPSHSKARSAIRG